jgi:hypothetical protein|tara:strand:- start:38 stop:781 length:744 start_codon:yes stop_codon:yes gene_type:complete
MVNINTVYTTVLYILNKEQRGYVTPAEFNSLAVLVQDEIFESYFPDGNQVNRQNQNNTQNDTEFFNMFKDISYKLYPFERTAPFTYNAGAGILGWEYTGTGTIFKLGEIISTYNTTNPQYDSITELASQSDFSKITRSTLTAPTVQYPLCTTGTGPNNSVLIEVSPQPNLLNINALFTPIAPEWRFTVGSLGQYIHSNTSVNFELDISEQTNLIIGILKYCGLIINDPTIIQSAAAEAQETEQNIKS